GRTREHCMMFPAQRGSPMCPRHALAIVCFGIILTPGWGHGGVWTSLPPDGAPIGSIVIDAANPATLYAAGLGFAYKSTDGAANWAPGGSIGDGYRRGGLLADPSDPSRLYAFLGGSPDHPGGIFTSVDGAATWTAISNDLGDC